MCTGVCSLVSSDHCGYIAVPGGRTNGPSSGGKTVYPLLDRMEYALGSASRDKQSGGGAVRRPERNLKVSNRLGHEAGDRLLGEVAGRLQLCIRAEDSVGRVGGDKFTVLLQEVAHEDAARWRQNVSQGAACTDPASERDVSRQR